MVFKSIKSTLEWFYDVYRGYPGSFNLERVRVDKSFNLWATEIECLAFIGYWINELSFEEQFILEKAYRHNLSDQEIGNFLNWEQKVKNWNSTETRKKRFEAEGKLKKKLIKIEIIVPDQKL